MTPIRRSRFGFPAPAAGSAQSVTRFSPTQGFTTDDPTVAPLGSITSGQNVRVRNGALEPRPLLSAFSTGAITGWGNSTATSANTAVRGAVMWTIPMQSNTQEVGAFRIISATSRQFYSTTITEQGTFGAWSTGSYVSSAGSNVPPGFRIGSGLGIFQPLAQTWFFAPLQTENAAGSALVDLAIIAGREAGRLYLYDPTGVDTVSNLTGSPGANDVIVFNNRVVAWHCHDLAENVYPSRVQWSVAGSIYDWTGIGSGFEDLADINGNGTRLFALEDQMILATENELWRGRYVGLPFVFSFSAINRSIGIPYPRAALQTDNAVVWLGYDYNVYQLTGDTVTPIGAAFQPVLRDTLRHPELAFFVRDSNHDALRLFYSDVSGTYPAKSIAIDLRAKQWSRDSYAHVMHYGVSVPKETVRQHAVFTSALTVSSFSGSASSELGGTPTSEAWLSGLFSGTPDRQHFVREARLLYTAGSASSLSVGVSMDGGVSFQETRVACSTSSAATQARTLPSVTGPLGVVRLRSEHTGWHVSTAMLWTTDVGYTAS